MGKRTTIIINDKIYKKLLQLQSEEILKKNSPTSLSAVINDILEEEIMGGSKRKSDNPPSRSVTVLEKITGMKNYDHLAFTIHNDDDFGVHLSEFVMHGLRMNFLNVMIVSERDAQKYVELLQQNSISALDLIKSQDIIILSHEDIFDKAGFGEIKPILRRVSDLVDLVKSKKKSGMNVIGTIAGTLENIGQHKKCLQLEKVWHESIPKFAVPIRVLCPYYSPVSSKTRDRLVLTHTDDAIR